MTAPFIYVAGTNGFSTVPFSLQTTELNALANGNTAVSSVGGSSGVFAQSNTGGALFSPGILFLAGGAFTPTAGGYLQGWFLLQDNASHYEKVVSNTAVPRAADFIIPLFASAYAANDISMSTPLVRWPSTLFKVLIRNVSGVALPATGNVLSAGSLEMQY